MKVKVFAAASPNDLEKEINEFLMSNPKAVSISYLVRPWVGQDLFSALLMYEESRPKKEAKAVY